MKEKELNGYTLFKVKQNDHEKRITKLEETDIEQTIAIAQLNGKMEIVAANTNRIFSASIINLLLLSLMCAAILLKAFL